MFGFGRPSNIFLDNFWTGYYVKHFFTFWFYGAQFSEQYGNVRFSLYISDRERLACRELFINVMSYDNDLDKSRTPKHVGHFWDGTFC